VDSAIISPGVREWAGRVKPGAQIIDCTARPLTGGAVANRVEQLTLHLTGGHGSLDLVRKDAPAHEIAGLRTAQAVRPAATAIPELVAWGDGWLITPLAPGTPLAANRAMPSNLTDTLGLGYRWAALQIPLQYLPWTFAYRTTSDVETALNQIDQALAQLPT
jgi:hypothetical protein